MRRAERLFQIIQILRRSRRPVTANALAAELEISTRTVYRDMADLIGQRVPIEGEPGLGYVLDPAFDMPPLMLTPEEIEAIVLGAQWVAARPDPLLARSAQDIISKIAAVVPKSLHSVFVEPAVMIRPSDEPLSSGLDMPTIRLAIRKGLKLRLRYRNGAGEDSERTVWPVVLGYAETHAVLIAWCELREGFRHFRTERICELQPLEQAYPARRTELRRRWERWRESERRMHQMPGA